MMFKNKKAYTTQLFGFFFILLIFSSLFLFLTFGMHYILYDYPITILKDDVSSALISPTGDAQTNIDALAAGFLGLTGFYDILFLVLIVSAFIQSTIAAIKTREVGFLSFFGFVTIGNLFLIFVLTYAVQIQGWIMNDLVYGVILVNISSTILSTFFNYSMYIGVFWYLWLVAMNQLDANVIKDKIPNVFSRKKFDSDEGRFEE